MVLMSECRHGAAISHWHFSYCPWSRDLYRNCPGRFSERQEAVGWATAHMHTHTHWSKNNRMTSEQVPPLYRCCYLWQFPLSWNPNSLHFFSFLTSPNVFFCIFLVFADLDVRRSIQMCIYLMSTGLRSGTSTELCCYIDTDTSRTTSVLYLDTLYTPRPQL